MVIADMGLRDMVGQEDAALLIILAGVVGVVVLMTPGGGSDYQPSQFCQDVASETEANYTSAVDSIDCRCESGEGYEERMNTPDEVANVTDINDVLVCDVTYGDREEELVYPLLRINETKYNNYNGTGNLSRENLTSRRGIVG
jgi:hypothetical protein